MLYGGCWPIISVNVGLSSPFHWELLITQYLLGIDRSAYDSSGLITTTCGDFTTLENDSSDFNLNRTSVLFQTNRRSENIGFFMVVTCVNPAFYNLDGCTQARTNQTVAPPVAGSRKRDTEMVSSLCNKWVHSPRTIPYNTSSLHHVLLLFLGHERDSYC